MPDIDALKAEQADLQARLKARQNRLGYDQNVKAIQARLAIIATELAANG